KKKSLSLLFIIASLLFVVNNSFSQQCRVDSAYAYTWNTATSQFIVQKKDYYTYDNSGQVIQILNRNRNNTDTSLWNVMNRYSYTYGAVSGRTLTALAESWNINASNWFIENADTFSYDMNG